MEQKSTKHCWKCEEDKPVSMFHKNRCNKDGYERMCKKCRHDWQQSHMTEEKMEQNRQRSKEYREENIDVVRAKVREYHRKHSEETNKKRREDPVLIERRRELYNINRDKLNAYKREWRKNNPDKVKAYAKIHFERHREHIKKVSDEYKKNNPLKIRLYWRKQYKKTRLLKNKHCLGILDPASTAGIGVITEHIVSTVLTDCFNYNKENFCAPYDLYSEKYGNINVKAATPGKKCNSSKLYYSFKKKEHSHTPDFYFLIGFSEDRLRIDHVWIVPGDNWIVTKEIFLIPNTERGLNKASCYETNHIFYNDVYINLDITELGEFRNVNS